MEDLKKYVNIGSLVTYTERNHPITKEPGKEYGAIVTELTSDKVATLTIFTPYDPCGCRREIAVRFSENKAPHTYRFTTANHNPIF